MTVPRASTYVSGIRSGDRAALARAITIIESTRPDHRSLGEEILAECLPHTGRSIRVGITGVPGAGKSTFIDALGARLIEREGRRLAVLAVDPSSRLSGGSILGDKTRMAALSGHPHAFIRPSPSAMAAGGVARRTREAIFLCEAAGYDTIFVETVGVGQAETAVHSMVDFFLLLALAGAGDELQGIKRGIIELADAIAVTKADEGNEKAAERAAVQLRSALRLFPPADSGWKPRVRTCSARTGLGLDELWNDVLEYEHFTRASGYFETRRRSQAKYWLRETLEERLIDALYADPEVARSLSEYEARVVRGDIGASAAAQAVLSAFRGAAGDADPGAPHATQDAGPTKS